MKTNELVVALRQLKINTKGIACLGCNYGLQCSTKGCRLIGLAADRLNEVGIILSIIKGMHAEAKDNEKSLLGIVLSLFDRYYGLTYGISRNIVPEPKRDHRIDVLDALTYAVLVSTPKKRIIDFERCADTEELATALRCINDNGYYMIGVTQDGAGTYTVFFRRPALD